MRFIRRIGPDPQPRSCSAAAGCPGLWELDDGSFAVIGVDLTTDLLALLPAGLRCGTDERIVVLPRGVLVSARHHIPAQ